MLPPFSNPFAIYVGLPVLYYPTPEESKVCGRKREVPAIVTEVHIGGKVDLDVNCPFGVAYSLSRVEKKSVVGQTRCWGFNEFYNKVIRGLN